MYCGIWQSDLLDRGGQRQRGTGRGQGGHPSILPRLGLMQDLAGRRERGEHLENGTEGRKGRVGAHWHRAPAHCGKAKRKQQEWEGG